MFLTLQITSIQLWENIQLYLEQYIFVWAHLHVNF